MLHYKNILSSTNQDNPTHYNLEVGLDEAGRGPLIGRVYAGAVVWPIDLQSSFDKDFIKDSKKLTPKKRKLALDWIKKNIKYWGVGYADEKEIDSINILNATKLAMDRAIDDIKSKLEDNITITNLIIDGTGWESKFKDYKVDSIVKGDNLYYSIAAASIIAKEYHDMHINQLINEEPILDEYYSLSTNMGYPTKTHRMGLIKYGPSLYHRKSFNGVVN